MNKKTEFEDFTAGVSPVFSVLVVEQVELRFVSIIVKLPAPE